MNNIALTGRLTADPIQKGGAVKFTLAVDDDFKKDNADFIPCTAWDKEADFIIKYAKKGSSAEITGALKTGNYDKPDGSKVYTMNVRVDKFKFPKGNYSQNKSNDFVNNDLEPFDNGDIPFDN